MKHVRDSKTNLTYVYNANDEIVDIYYTPDAGRQIINTYYWYWDMQGRLKQDVSKPVKYHGKDRIYVKEDVEEILPNKKYKSYLTVYYGKTPIAYVERIAELTGQNIDQYRYMTKTFIDRLLSGNWRLYKVENPELEPKNVKFNLEGGRYKLDQDRKKTTTKRKVVRKTKPTKPKQVIKSKKVRK